MFTGIIEEIGTVKGLHWSNNSLKIEINCSKVLADVKKGDSIATNGICLTVVDFNSSSFSADVMPETVKRTTMRDLKVGDKVNLERALLADGRFGGHIVQGHIDGVGTIIDIEERENSHIVKIRTDLDLLELMVSQGSIGVDGISLTIADLADSYFTVSIIPTTEKETTLLDKKVGDGVNLECDILGKYIKGLLEHREKRENSNITEDFLKEHGFM